MIGIDDLIQETIKPVISDLYSQLKGEGRQLFQNRLTEYQFFLFNKCSFQKTLIHRFEDVPINDFYIPLFIRPFSGYQNKSKERIPTENIKDLVRQNGNLIIFGNAGSGKSTLLKHFIISSLSKNFKTPILIELRNLVETEGNFDKYVSSKIFEYQKLGLDDSIIDRLLSKENFIFILDGFDEISAALKPKASQSIKEFIQKYNGNNYIISSRHYDPLSAYDKFKIFEICEFTNTEAKEFIKKQFTKKEIAKANEIISEINKAKQSTVKYYLTSPLLLSLFIITYLTHPEIPFSKSEFYYNVFDSLFYRIDKYLKADFVHEKISKLSKDEFINILTLFSFLGYFENKYEFTSKYFDETIQKIKDIKRLRFDTQDFLTDLSVNINILIQDGKFYRFPHRTIQEYFCANFISKLTEFEQKKEIYHQLALSVKDNLFLITLLIEIDYINSLEYIVLPAIKDHSNFIKLNYLKEPINAAKVSSQSHIEEMLDTTQNLRYIRYKFKEHQPYKDENSTGRIFYNITAELKPAIIEAIHFYDSSPYLIELIERHIENAKSQDQKIIDIIKKSR